MDDKDKAYEDGYFRGFENGEHQGRLVGMDGEFLEIDIGIRFSIYIFIEVKYGIKNHWEVNVKDLYLDAAALFLYRWAKSMIGATNDFYIEVIIEQKNGEVIKTDLKALSSYQFAGRPESWIQAVSYMPGPFLMIDEVEPGPCLPFQQV